MFWRANYDISSFYFSLNNEPEKNDSESAHKGNNKTKQKNLAVMKCL